MVPNPALLDNPLLGQEDERMSLEFSLSSLSSSYALAVAPMTPACHLLHSTILLCLLLALASTRLLSYPTLSLSVPTQRLPATWPPLHSQEAGCCLQPCSYATTIFPGAWALLNLTSELKMVKSWNFHCTRNSKILGKIFLPFQKQNFLNFSQKGKFKKIILK